MSRRIINLYDTKRQFLWCNREIIFSKLLEIDFDMFGEWVIWRVVKGRCGKGGKCGITLRRVLVDLLLPQSLRSQNQKAGIYFERLTLSWLKKFNLLRLLLKRIWIGIKWFLSGNLKEIFLLQKIIFSFNIFFSSIFLPSKSFNDILIKVN